MAEELDIPRENDDVAARPSGDGMPLGMAHQQAMQEATTYRLPPMPGGLDG